MIVRSELLRKENPEKKIAPSAPMSVHGQVVPKPRYDTYVPPEQQPINKGCRKKIPIRMHGTLDEMIKGRTFKIPISETGKNVWLEKIYVLRASNTTPFTFVVKEVGSGEKFLNKDKYMSCCVNDPGMEPKQVQCFTYVPSKIPHYETRNPPVIFSALTETVRNKLITQNDDVRKVKQEVEDYLAIHSTLSHQGYQGAVSTTQGYLNELISLANGINITDVEKNHQVTTTSNGEQIINVSTQSNDKFYKLINMALTKDKLHMSKNWTEKVKKTHQVLPAVVKTKAFQIIRDVKKSQGVLSHLEIELKPDISKTFNIESFMQERYERKPEYCEVILELDVNYKEK